MLALSASPEARVICIGECMVELARGDDGRFGLGFGGDTYNTAIYLKRAGVSVAYATLVGDDPYSQGIIDLARTEGIAVDLIGSVPERNAGLYLIETRAGERTFHYWRDRSPARELFDGDHAVRVVSAMKSARLIYLSGITLSLYDAHGLDALFVALVDARARGVRIVIDGNYRPRSWRSSADDVVRARSVFERFFGSLICAANLRRRTDVVGRCNRRGNADAVIVMGDRRSCIEVRWGWCSCSKRREDHSGAGAATIGANRYHGCGRQF